MRLSNAVLSLTVLLPLAVATGCARDTHVAAPLSHGAVATPEAHATDVGVRVLERGGNAVDAAVAVHFALAVTFPSAGNLGGGGFLLLHEPGGEREGPDVFALDYRETAPAAAHRDMFLDPDGEVVPGESLYTHRAAGVPGSVAGMWAAHERFGSLPWTELVAPSIELAEDGFILDALSAAAMARGGRLFAALDEARREHVDFPRYFHGKRGDRLVQPELALTLRRIARDGPAGFYEGETARLIVEEMERGDGLITADDLLAYRALWREPVEGRYRGRRVVSMPPPSSGGVALLQMLAMLEGFDSPQRLSARHIHLLAEVEKRAFADRATYLGDPDRVDVPIEALLDPAYLGRRASSIDVDTRTDPASLAAGELPSPVAESVETTHFSVVDRQGRAVSCTTTMNASYGSGIVVDGAGFLLNNEMDDFSAKPGVPNLYGVTGGEANAIAPGRRMLSSMTPTLVFDPNGRLELVLGSPGGPTIITTILQVLLNVTEFSMPLEDAIASPRVHHQWPPRKPGADSIVVESDPRYRIPDATRRELEQLGYIVAEVPSLGDVQAIFIRENVVEGVADARRGGKARRAHP